MTHLLEIFKNRRLISYYYLKKGEIEFYAGQTFILDSGAFSAHNSGAEIDLDTYITFLKENHVPIYFNLDVIGNAEATWKNQKTMESAGLNPLPVYHYGEDKKYLFKCLDYEYFGLGGMVKKTSTILQDWLDRVFTMIPDKDGKICNKIHGLGMTSWELMRRYPWYSVDSTGWAIASAMGDVFYPQYTKGKLDWNKCPKQTKISKNKNLNEFIVAYAKSIGIPIGDTDFVSVPENYELQKGESWASGNNHKTVRRVAVPGIINDSEMRCLFNCTLTRDYIQNSCFKTCFDKKRKQFF